MMIKKDNMFPLIKVKTPTGIDFFKEHKSIIDSNGYVERRSSFAFPIIDCPPLLRFQLCRKYRIATHNIFLLILPCSHSGLMIALKL